MGDPTHAYYSRYYGARLDEICMIAINEGLVGVLSARDTTSSRLTLKLHHFASHLRFIRKSGRSQSIRIRMNLLELRHRNAFLCPSFPVENSNRLL